MARPGEAALHASPPRSASMLVDARVASAAGGDAPGAPPSSEQTTAPARRAGRELPVVPRDPASVEPSRPDGAGPGAAVGLEPTRRTGASAGPTPALRSPGAAPDALSPAPAEPAPADADLAPDGAPPDEAPPPEVTHAVLHAHPVVAEVPATSPPPSAGPAHAAALTPLEQSVRDLLVRASGGGDGDDARRDDDERDLRDARRGELDLLAALDQARSLATPTAPAARAPGHGPGAAPPGAPTSAAAPADDPAPDQTPNHLHLVVGDDANRVVVTVAVRGNDVNVAVRAGDEQTASALARNAGVLDDAMRGRGLSLTGFAAHRDAPDRRPGDDRDPTEHQRDQRERRARRDAPTFELE